MKLKITENDQNILVESTYNSLWVNKARKLGGKWQAPNWVFPIAVKNSILEELKNIYGYSSETKSINRGNVKIKALRELRTERDAVDFLGFTIAKAFGRDSGARLGDNVSCLSGDFKSGGSVKNWYTIISEGSEFLLINFPLDIIDGVNMDKEESYWEVIPELSKRQILENKKKDLLEQLSQVESELAEL